MTRLAATLGTTGIAAALMLAALQILPSRDGGTAQAGTEPAASAPAWTDPPRAAIPPVAAAPAPIVPVAAVPVRTAEPAPEAARSETRRPAQARRRLAARVRHARAVRMAIRQPAPAWTRASAAPASAPVRMAGPVGDILHGLGLD